MNTPRTVVAGPATWNTMVRLDHLPAPRPHTLFARGSVRTLGGTSAARSCTWRTSVWRARSSPTSGRIRRAS